MTKIVGILALAFCGTAWAQTGELWFNGGESLLSNAGIGTDQPFGGTKNDVALTDGFRFSFRFGFNQGDHFGHEVEYAYNRTALKFNNEGGAKEGMAFHQGGYNFLYYILTTQDSRVRPFLTAGVHFDDFVPPGTSVNQGAGSNKIGFNYGAGVKVRLTHLFGIRFDLRQYITGKPFGLPLSSGALLQTEVSAGVGIGF